jgi:pyrimidine operon attenuation protein/uracil phosphoribosyltransferase
MTGRRVRAALQALWALDRTDNLSALLADLALPA